jgi:two-component system, sensor histidine kinase and response regulator
LTDCPATLDAASLDTLRQLDPGNQRGLLRKLSEAYERMASTLEAELLAAAAAGPDLARLRRAAHTLKSSSANLGALHLSSQCQQLETLCQRGDAAAAQALLPPLLAALADARQAVRRLA